MAIRPFADTLTAIRFGSLAEDLSTALNQLTTACVETGRKGDLTLKLTLRPGKAGQLEILDDIKVKLPPAERGTTLMFATPEGNLTREDPRQMQLAGIREVPPTKPAKEIAA